MARMFSTVASPVMYEVYEEIELFGKVMQYVLSSPNFEVIKLRKMPDLTKATSLHTSP